MPDFRDLPLFRWGEELRRGRRDRRRRNRHAAAIAAAAVMGGALVSSIVSPPRVRLVWNVSASAPVGLYWIAPADGVERGDMVISMLPAGVRRLASTRGYVPANVPLVKRAAATAGDSVCAIGEAVYVNGELAAFREEADSRARPMPWWTGCEALGPGELFLLMGAERRSFDSRYFGVVDAGNIVGRARLLWER